MIAIDSLHKKYGKLTALAGVSMELERGEAVALVGPNASGKSTLIKCILGLVKADGGTVRVNGKSILGSYDYRKQIGYMPQISRYPDNLTISQLFRMIRDIRKGTYDTLDEELFDAFRIDEMGGKNFSALSGGTRQKVSACLAFMFNPQILILDEPTAGLDPLSTEILKNKIMRESRNGKMILVTSHILSDLEEIAGEVVYLLDGSIVFKKEMGQLMQETGTNKLGKAIARIMGEPFLTGAIQQKAVAR